LKHVCEESDAEGRALGCFVYADYDSKYMEGSIRRMLMRLGFVPYWYGLYFYRSAKIK
jgi:hypothetical protein